MQIRSQPHGQHTVARIEDHDTPGMRIFEIRDSAGLGCGRLGFIGEELDWLTTWWLQERQCAAQGENASPSRTITSLRCLDDQGLEWEWASGANDFHVRYEAELGTWVLEQFRSADKVAVSAHLEEQECESLQDALLFSLEAKAV